MRMAREKKCRLLLSFFAVLFIALGSMGGCNSSNGGGDDPLADADLVMGGLLYDKWWVAAGVDEPEGTNPLYPTEENAMFKDPPRAGSQTWRCKECHGWDYLGVDGFYGPPSSHFTNIEGVLQVADSFTKTRAEFSPEELFDIIKFGIVGQMSAYEGLLSDQDIWDLVKFLYDGMIDNRLIVDYSSPDMNEVIEPFNLEIGEMIFNDVCAGCHGMDGEGLAAFGTDGISLNTVALANPVEFMHKIRMGQPGTSMPSMVDLGFDTDDAKDVLAYTQMGLVPGGGCCEIAQNDCEDGQTLEQCNALGGELHEEICDEVPECNVAPAGEGCCVIAENDCVDDTTEVECDDLVAESWEEGLMCSGVEECNVAPDPDGAALYANNCASCHGADGTGGITGVSVVGESAQEITDALLRPSMASVAPLSAAEVDAIALFLAP